MPAKESKTPAKAAAKAPGKAVAKAAGKAAGKATKAAPAKAAAKTAKPSIKKADKGKKGKKDPVKVKADRKAAIIAKVNERKRKRKYSKGRSGYRGNLKVQSQKKEDLQKFFLRKEAKNMSRGNKNAKSSKDFKDLKKKAIELKVRLNHPATRAVAARERTKVLANAQGWKNSQRPKVEKKIKKWQSWREKCPLFINRPKNTGIGGDVRPKTNLKRFVRWPKYIRIQRQKRILLERLKVPPTIHQFRRTVRRNHALNLFRLLRQYKPEDRVTRKKRLLRLAKLKAKGGDLTSGKYKKPITVVTGVKHCTQLVFSKQAKLVLIAADVDPIEVVLWLPSLCRKMDVPYMIVRGKARMGTLVNMKTCSTIAITSVKKEHEKQLSNYVAIARRKFNDNLEARKQWGGLKLGPKSLQKIRKQRSILRREKLMRKRADAEKKKAKKL